MENKQDGLIKYLRSRFVNRIYATHNNSAVIVDALRRCLQELRYDDIGLNIGSGSTKIHPQIINLDLISDNGVDCCALGEFLPFPDKTFSLIITQETLEHTQNPDYVMSEIYRVLKDGGKCYCQVPFVIGYHPGPEDYWRFTKTGLLELINRHGLQYSEIQISVGPATGFYRIVVEFGAIFFSTVLPISYIAFKGILALVFYPLKWLDPIFRNHTQVDRISGGYYVIAHKKG